MSAQGLRRTDPLHCRQQCVFCSLCFFTEWKVTWSLKSCHTPHLALPRGDLFHNVNVEASQALCAHTVKEGTVGDTPSGTPDMLIADPSQGRLSCGS
jgi:hypothetical protein